MSTNPYAAPTAPLSPAAAGKRQMYSPTQVAAGAFLGGPLAATHFLWANFHALGNRSAARATPWLGALATIVLIALGYAMPEHSSNSILVIPQIVLARMVAERMQMTKAAIEASTEFAFQSGWKVFGLSLLWLAVTLLMLFGAIWAGLASGVLA